MLSGSLAGRGQQLGATLGAGLETPGHFWFSASEPLQGGPPKSCAGACCPKLGEGRSSSVKGTPGVCPSPPNGAQHPGTPGTGVREGEGGWGREESWRPGLSLGTRRHGCCFWPSPSSGGPRQWACPGSDPSASRVSCAGSLPQATAPASGVLPQLMPSLTQAPCSLHRPPTSGFLPASCCLLLSASLDL